MYAVITDEMLDRLSYLDSSIASEIIVACVLYQLKWYVPDEQFDLTTYVAFSLLRDELDELKELINPDLPEED